MAFDETLKGEEILPIALCSLDDPVDLIVKFLDLFLGLTERVDLKLIHELAVEVLVESALLELGHRRLVPLQLHHGVHLVACLARRCEAAIRRISLR